MNSQQLSQTMRENHAIRAAYSHYLNLNPRFLTADLVNDLAHDCAIETDEAFLILLSAALGLDTSIPSHRLLERNYIRAGIQKKDPKIYQNDAYCRTVRFPTQKYGKWETKTETYAPYEPFVCGHPTLTKDLREIPKLGYFDEEFPFPAILESGVEWMTVTPNEIETMREPIAKSFGNALTLGLGLGYFAFHAIQKSEVRHLTVVERDRDVIELFRTALLPQFPNANKLTIVQADAFDFLKDPKTLLQYDSIFADLWHDPSDGLDLYIRLRKTEKEANADKIDYWIEPTILSTLRDMVYDRITDKNAPLQIQGVSKEELLSNRFLRERAPDLTKNTKNI